MTKRIFLLLLFPFFLFCEKQTYLTIRENPKYKGNEDHFDYVNPNAHKGGNVHLYHSAPFDSLNSLILKGTSPASNYLVYGNLFHESEDEPSSSYPYIAESVEIDGDSVTFYIDKRAQFSDGSSITADDVIFTFNALVTEGHPKFKEYFRDVDSVSKSDDHTVVFKSKNTQNCELPFILGQLPVLSKKFYETVAFGQTSLKPFPSSGPYEFDEVIPGQKITYKRIKNWWAKDIFTQKGKNNVDQMAYVVYRDDNSCFEAFKKGLFDVRYETSLQNWAIAYNFDAIKDGSIKKIVIKQNFPKPISGIVINAQRIQDRRVRKALNIVFDFYWCNKHLFYGLMQRNDSYFTKSPLSSDGKLSDDIRDVLKAYEDKLPEYVLKEDVALPYYDSNEKRRIGLTDAIRLLEDAGYTIKDQKLMKNGKPFSITMLIENPRTEKTALAFKENLKQVGITLKIVKLDKQAYIKRVQQFDYDLCFDGHLTTHPQSLSPGNEQRWYFSTDSATNYSKINDPIVNDLIEKLVSSQTKEDTIRYAKALDFLLLQGYYRILAWHAEGFFFAVKKRVGGVNCNPDYPRAKLFMDHWWIEE